MSKLEKIAIAAPIALYLLWQGAEVSWALKAYSCKKEAKAIQAQAFKDLARSDEIKEFTSSLREKKKRMYVRAEKKNGVVQDDLYWFVTTRINLDEEEMAKHYELYVAEDKQARELAEKADKYMGYADKYGIVSNIRKLVRR